MLCRMEAIARFARTHMVIGGNYLRSLSGYLPIFPQSLWNDQYAHSNVR